MAPSGIISYVRESVREHIDGYVVSYPSGLVECVQPGSIAPALASLPGQWPRSPVRLPRSNSVR